MKATRSYKPNIVVIGGGTGSFTLLTGLKQYTPNITALVNMSDDGGSTGLLRDELGVLPPGDVRQCLVALSDTQRIRDLFNYRFGKGSLKGHNFGNLFLSAVEKMTDSFEEAIQTAGEVLHITGRVIPTTLDHVELILKTKTGRVITGESKIGHANFESCCPDISLQPEPEAAKKAMQAIEDADIVVIAPGNLYGSLAPALVVKGIRRSLKKTKAKIVYVCNLVTKPGQTDGFFVHDYVDEVERFLGAKLLDFVIFNTDEPSEQQLSKYTHDGEYIIGFDLSVMESKHYKTFGLPLIDKSPVAHAVHDPIARNRTLIRHDSDLVAREVMKILFP